MSEEFIIGLFWGVFGTLLLQVASVLIFRMGTRRQRQDGGEARQGMAGREIEGELQAAQIERMQRRLAVLEQITTDPADRTARAIDALR